MAKRNINQALAHRFQFQVATFANCVVVIVPNAIWLITSRGNAMPCLVEKPRIITWNCHVLSRRNNIFHEKIWHLTHEILRVAMHVHACKNEVIIERYCTSVQGYIQMYPRKSNAHN